MRNSAPCAPSLLVDTGCATPARPRAAEKFKFQILKHIRKCRRTHTARSPKVTPSMFFSSSGSQFGCPTTAPLRGGVEFRWRSASPHSSAARQTKQPGAPEGSQLSFLPAFLPDQHLPAELVEITKKKLPLFLELQTPFCAVKFQSLVKVQFLTVHYPSSMLLNSLSMVNLKYEAPESRP